METEPQKRICIGEWIVDSGTGTISRNGESTRLEVRTMRLLLALAARPGEIVSSEDLLADAWSGVTVSQDSVYQAIASLRRLLGDDPKQPAYIVTVPRLGYRLIAPVTAPRQETPPAALPRHRRRDLAIAAMAASLILVLGGLFFYPRIFSAHRHQSAAIAVLPFLDLTAGMQEEEFADGMTEELIDDLSKLHGLHVSAPTAVFYYKDKQLPLADMARSLDVAYVVDGSVRKSGDRVRIAVRLVRAHTGTVLWAGTYDRPFHDRIQVQDEIAAKVAQALGQTSL
ncbi:winged helix-turn-helix domain-containing protein [Silvibacterium acidisoli]|uniref:winged helix-turn-helix domain-containing protein n=1 Tax=Acidobacteriaceae bacterium ZG23-2 TaxID=2883246 RepID=UPI00406C039B